MSIIIRYSPTKQCPEDEPLESFFQNEDGSWVDEDEGRRLWRLWEHATNRSGVPVPAVICYEPGCWAGLSAPCKASDLSLFRELVESREPGMIWWPSLWPILWPSSQGNVCLLVVHEEWGQALLDIYCQRRGWGDDTEGFIHRWPYTQRTGTSSAAIYTCLTHRTPPSAPPDFDPSTIPMDLDAFQRCIELVRGAGWRNRLGEMKRMGPGWVAVIAAWDRWEDVLNRADPLELKTLDAEIQAIYYADNPGQKEKSATLNMDTQTFSGPAFDEGGALEEVDLERLNAGGFAETD